MLDGPLVAGRKQHPRAIMARLGEPIYVQVVDYDASTGTLYEPARLPTGETRAPSDERILGDPAFHAQNVYGLVMRTLGRFECRATSTRTSRP